MPAVPGGPVALGLASPAALGRAERDPRSSALLRARGPRRRPGARRRALVRLSVLESLVLGLLAGAIGTAISIGAVHLSGSAGGVGLGRALAAFGICAVLAAAGAAAARVGAGL